MTAEVRVPFCVGCRHFVPSTYTAPSFWAVFLRTAHPDPPTPPLCAKIKDPIFGTPVSVWDARDGACGLAGKLYEPLMEEA